MRPLFSSQTELSISAFYFQDGGKAGAQKDRSFGTYLDGLSYRISL